MKTIVLGPPGTGKTTTLLDEVDKYLKQTDPNNWFLFIYAKSCV
jgi:Cdc6-like AAA superfamily ATPase